MIQNAVLNEPERALYDRRGSGPGRRSRRGLRSAT
jgi:hypothetical protein